MRVYLDTSALVALYYPESWSGQVSALVSGCPLPFSALHELETRNAMMLKVYRQEVDLRAVKAAIQAIESDLNTGSLVRPPVDWAQMFCMSVDLSTKHTPTRGCRSLDILHVALAQSVEAEIFLSLDDRQKALARKVGLTVADIDGAA